MNFMEAINAIENGKKVRRIGFVPIIKKENLIMSEDGTPINLTLFDYNAIDWDIVEDKESLSSEEKIKKIKEILK